MKLFKFDFLDSLKAKSIALASAGNQRGAYEIGGKIFCIEVDNLLTHMREIYRQGCPLQIIFDQELYLKRLTDAGHINDRNKDLFIAKHSLARHYFRIYLNS